MPINEQERISELHSYKILDSLPERDVDDLVELAAAICNTPVSFVSFIDSTRQWFKSKKGVDLTEVPITDTICQHLLHDPGEVLVINDTSKDDRLKNNPFICGKPPVRFYAGAPIASPNGHVIGSICIVDHKPRKITNTRKKALMLLAKKAMDLLETRKQLIEKTDRIAFNAITFNKIADQAPGAIYQFEINPEGKMLISFLSKGIINLHEHHIAKDLIAHPELLFKVILDEDQEMVNKSFQESYKMLSDWQVEYRVKAKDGSIKWHWGIARPERMPNGTVVWYGTIQDITEKKEYVNSLEQMLFDISHVMRRPISTMAGLTHVLQLENSNISTLTEYIEKLKSISSELDKYTRTLNEKYSAIKLKFTGK